MPADPPPRQVAGPLGRPGSVADLVTGVALALESEEVEGLRTPALAKLIQSGPGDDAPVMLQNAAHLVASGRAEPVTVGWASVAGEGISQGLCALARKLSHALSHVDVDVPMGL